MKILIEGFIYSIMLAFICFVSIEFVIVNKQIANAQSYYNYVKDTVEINDFEQHAMDYLVAEAKKNGYVLSFTDKESSYPIQNCYWIELAYPIRINLLGVSRSDSLSGYVKSYD